MPDSRYGWIVHYNGPAIPVQLSGKQIMQSVQRYHQVSKGWRDYAYSFGIDQDGNVYEGRGWFVVGGHTSGRFKGTGLSNNSHAHAVFFMIGQGQEPSQAALGAFAALVAEGVKRGVPGMTTPHKIAAPSLGTSCPGDTLTRVTLQGYFLNTDKDPLMSSKATVGQLYVDILGREADEAGLAYWSEQLDSKAVTLDFIRWEFLRVRLAADDARVTALATASGTVVPVEAANAAFNKFIDDLIALRSGS